MATMPSDATATAVASFVNERRNREARQVAEQIGAWLEAAKTRAEVARADEDVFEIEYARGLRVAYEHAAALVATLLVTEQDAAAVGVGERILGWLDRAEAATESAL